MSDKQRQVVFLDIPANQPTILAHLLRNSIKKGDKVAVSPSFPPTKLEINGLHVGDIGEVVEVYHTRVGGGIALVAWDKQGYRTTANVCDLEPA
jgi:hypothetical protein